MKREVKEIIVFLILTALALSAVSCAMIGGEGKKPSETTAASDTSAPEETTTDSVAASVDPAFSGSSGLNYASKGDGTCTLTGIGTCTDNFLNIPEVAENGDIVKAISASAFAGLTTINAVQIPASVETIGDGAFAGCTSLAYISVSEENKAFCDLGGVLYSADKTRLISVPAGSTLPSLTITQKVKEIVPRATEGCSGIGKVLYEGSEAEWKKLSIGSGNDVLTKQLPTCMKQAGK